MKKTNTAKAIRNLLGKKKSRETLILPWLQMAGEPDESFQAFTEYRMMPHEDRTISGLLKRPKMSILAGKYKVSWFYQKANDWAWSSRAEAYDHWWRYNNLTKQYGKFLDTLDYQADIGRQLTQRAARFLIGDDEVDTQPMWLGMQPRDLINAMRLGTTLERESMKLQREAMIANEQFKDLDELAQIFKPGSIQEQMFEAVMRDDWEALETMMTKVVNANRTTRERGMPTKDEPLTEQEREKLRVMSQKLLKGALSAPDELIAELARGREQPQDAIH